MLVVLRWAMWGCALWVSVGIAMGAVGGAVDFVSGGGRKADGTAVHVGNSPHGDSIPRCPDAELLLIEYS